MRPHRNLLAWQESIQFVVDIYQLTKAFPSEEKFGLVSQMRRAAVSIAANIAEGAAQNTDKHKIKFYFIAEGSASEMDTFLELSRLLKLIPEENWLQMNTKLDRISALVSELRRSVEKRMNKGKE